MAFEKAGDILRDAQKKGVGVPAFNVSDCQMIKLAIYQAEVMQSPILIACYPGFKDILSIDMIAEITKLYAKKVKVPIGVHLDHSTDYAEIMQAMRAGYDSVMYDGSALPFEENVKNTAEVVKVAKTLGIDVEAELGHVGSAENASDFTDTSHFTQVDMAVQFMERTGCNYLAVAVGNAHGNYVQEPRLDLDRIRDISHALKAPLVLHGGSGIPDEQTQEAIRRGIVKINVGTEYFNTYYKACETHTMSGKSGPDMIAASEVMKKEVMSYLEGKIRLFLAR